MRRILPIMALAALSGCISFGSEPPPFLMNLTPDEQVSAGATRSAPTGAAITIERPTVPQKLAVNRLPVDTGETTVAYLQNAQWVEAPAELFRSLLAETVAARTGRIVIDPAIFTADPGTVVHGQLSEFGLDAPAREVNVVYDATITSSSGVRTRRFAASEPVAIEDAQTVSRALNRAANRVAVEFSDWVGS